MTDEQGHFQNKTRIRISGLLLQNNSLLLIQLHSPVADRLVWTPPGGGLKFGEHIEACLVREFKEETGLEILPGDLQCIHELVQPPYHAVEFYFAVTRMGGELNLGIDPELDINEQILRDLQWIPVSKLQGIDLVPPGLVNLIQTYPDGVRHPVRIRSGP